MLRVLVLFTLLVSAADHWTTWLCLRAPIVGWDVQELNPISEWLFQSVGVGTGLLLDSAVTGAGLIFLVATPRLPRSAKLAFLATVVVATGYAVVNNLGVISRMGLSIAAH
jgi:hypothetical protein